MIQQQRRFTRSAVAEDEYHATSRTAKRHNRDRSRSLLRSTGGGSRKIRMVQGDRVVIRVEIGKDMTEITGKGEQAPNHVVFRAARAGFAQRSTRSDGSGHKAIRSAGGPSAEKTEVRAPVKRRDDRLSARGQHLRQPMQEGRC